MNKPPENIIATLKEELEKLTKELSAYYNKNAFQHKDSVGANLAFTDSENIYWKVYQPLYANRAIKDVTIAAYMENFISTFAPLSTKVFPLSNGYVATLWPWVDITPVTKRNKYDMIELASKAHSTLIPKHITDFIVPRDIEALRQRIESHLQKASEVRPEYKSLCEIPTRLHEEIVYLKKDKKTFFCHGDTHGQNFGVNSGRVVLFDWELSSIDTKEWDYSLLLLSHYWGDKHKVSLDELEGDKDLIKICAAFRASSQVGRFLVEGKIEYAENLFEDVKRFAPEFLSSNQLRLF